MVDLKEILKQIRNIHTLYNFGTEEFVLSYGTRVEILFSNLVYTFIDHEKIKKNLQ